MNKHILIFLILLFGLNRVLSQTITDFDGNVYDTITIGTQVWMKQNLKSTHYADGSAMVDGTIAGNIGNNFTTKYYFDYENTPLNSLTYGKLYTWAAVMNGATSSNTVPSGVQGICPTDWHVPSNAEWIILVNYLGGESVAGGKMKEIGLTHWNSPNAGATNSSGFTGISSGARYSNGTFGYLGVYVDYWSTTQTGTGIADILYLYSDFPNAFSTNNNEAHAFSVRCLQDKPTSIGEINNSEKIKIYPNPANNKLTVAAKPNSQMEIINIQGQIIKTYMLTNAETTIDISNLPESIYTIKIITNNGIFIQKLIKK